MLMLSSTLHPRLLAACVGRTSSFPCDREGRKQIRAALESAARCFEEMGGGTSSCKELPFDPHKQLLLLPS